MQAARQGLWAGKVFCNRSEKEEKYKKPCNVIRILQAASNDRCGNDCVHFSQCQHFINQVGWQDEAERTMMKQETDRNLSGDRSNTTQKKWDDPILQ